MASRFQGRDFQTLRQEIIDFVKERAPDTWDSTNASDPMIRFIETVAMLGDQLHYYIDAMRREADMSTASLASSVYSYALREGYLLVLPRSTHFRIKLYSTIDTVPDVSFKKFDPFSIGNNGQSYYVLTPLDSTPIYPQYPKSVTDSDGDVIEIKDSPEIEIVAGELKEVTFSFSDIDYYSRIELPDSRIDADMCQLMATSGQDTREIIRVEDVISDIAQANVYSLTPSFIGGVERLYIEFPYNYRNLFPSNTQFTFRYLTIRKENKPALDFESDSFADVFGKISTYGGYREYENPESIKINYKNYVRDFSSLVTKNDYKAFVNYNINSRCQVFDKADEYNGLFKGIPVRTIYILSDLEYTGRQELRREILKRSSRSDNIFMIPYGKKLYRVFIIVEANLMATSEDNIRSSIANALESFYNDITEVRDPIESVIYHKVHECNSSISRAWVILISEYDDNGLPNFPTEELLEGGSVVMDGVSYDLNYFLENNKIFSYFYNRLPDLDNYVGEKDKSYVLRLSECQPESKTLVIQQNLLIKEISNLAYEHGLDSNYNNPSYEYIYPDVLPYSNVNENLNLVDEGNEGFYDSEDIDTMSINDPDYEKTHFVLPSLFNTIIWVYSN